METLAVPDVPLVRSPFSPCPTINTNATTAAMPAYDTHICMRLTIDRAGRTVAIGICATCCMMLTANWSK